jgi:hypothetical protein
MTGISITKRGLCYKQNTSFVILSIAKGLFAAMNFGMDASLPFSMTIDYAVYKKACQSELVEDCAEACPPWFDGLTMTPFKNVIRQHSS